MSLTIQTLVDESRRLIQDRTVPYRTSDDDLAALVTDYFRELWRVRPDAYVPYSANTRPPEFGAQDFAKAWPVGEQFYRAGVHYVVGHLELQDDEHVNSGRAQNLIDRSFQMLVGTL